MPDPHAWDRGSFPLGQWIDPWRRSELGSGGKRGSASSKDDSVAISPALLAMIVCPDTRQSLREADAALVAQLNERIRAGTLRNRGGDRLSSTLDGGLVREDGGVLYPVIDGIPVLLADEAISLPPA